MIAGGAGGQAQLDNSRRRQIGQAEALGETVFPIDNALGKFRLRNALNHKKPVFDVGIRLGPDARQNMGFHDVLHLKRNSGNTHESLALALKEHSWCRSYGVGQPLANVGNLCLLSV